MRRRMPAGVDDRLGRSADRDGRRRLRTCASRLSIIGRAGVRRVSPGDEVGRWSS
jgi:hypothetical protein